MPLSNKVLRSAVLGIALVFLATGCGAQPGTPPSGSDDSQQNEPSGSTSDDSPGTVGDPCTVITPDQLETVFGETLGNPRPQISHATSNDLKWTATGCGWGDDDTLAVRATVATAEDFEDGVLHCVEPLVGISELEEVSGLGERAWWRWTDAFGMDGELRVCTSEAFYEVTISQPEGESSVARDQAAWLANLLVG